MPGNSEPRVEPINAFQDNYIWILRDRQFAALVDPGDAEPVFARLQAEQLTPIAILLTHHHGDHVGGVAALRSKFRIPVYGPASEAIPQCTHALHGNERVDLPELGLRFRVLNVPGHTAGHIAYFGHDILFCGDTLFCGGCGRLLGGSAKQLFDSLQSLAELAPTTRIYCAHEYTLANLRFAVTVEPDNTHLALRLRSTQQLRDLGQPTVPSTLAEELATNPFLRCDKPTIWRAAEARSGRRLHPGVEVFAEIRRWKDGFRASV